MREKNLREGKKFTVHELSDIYCTNDVRILMYALTKYRSLIKGITKIDIIR